MKTGFMAGALALTMGMVFSGAVGTAGAADLPKPDEQGCIVSKNIGYKHEANVEKDAANSGFWSDGVSSGKYAIGQAYFVKDKNPSPRIEGIGVVGVYKKDPSCDLK